MVTYIHNTCTKIFNKNWKKKNKLKGDSPLSSPVLLYRRSSGWTKYIAPDPGSGNLCSLSRKLRKREAAWKHRIYYLSILFIYTSELVKFLVFSITPGLVKLWYFTSKGAVSFTFTSDLTRSGYFISNRHVEAFLAFSTASAPRLDPEAGGLAFDRNWSAFTWRTC